MPRRAHTREEKKQPGGPEDDLLRAAEPWWCRQIRRFTHACAGLD
jgi:hypothetical protein